MPDQSVHVFITSPPYFGMRDYKVPPCVWGGDPDCDHVWGPEIPAMHVSNWDSLVWNDGRPADASKNWKNKVKDSKQATCGAFCQECNAWKGSLGQEPEITLYVKHSLMLYTELHRVLRDDGTFWLNIGDSYAGARSAGNMVFGNPAMARPCREKTKRPAKRIPAGLQSGDLCLIPHRTALALQGFTVISGDELWQLADWLKHARQMKDWAAVEWVESLLRSWAFTSQTVSPAGWRVRATIVWNKSNPLPESATSRPTRDFEFVFLLAKSNKPQFWTHSEDIKGTRQKPKPDYRWIHRETGEIVREQPAGDLKQIKKEWKRFNCWNGYEYYFDMYAIKEPQKEVSLKRAFSTNHLEIRKDRGQNTYALSSQAQAKTLAKLRHAIETGGDTRRNKRSTWIVPTHSYKEAHFATFPVELITPMILAGTPFNVCSKCGAPWSRVAKKEYEYLSQKEREHDNTCSPQVHLSWCPTCDCDAEPSRAIVGDPFMGAGTVAVAATMLGRDYTGGEIGENYIAMTNRRLAGITLPLPIEEFA